MAWGAAIAGLATLASALISNKTQKSYNNAINAQNAWDMESLERSIQQQNFMNQWNIDYAREDREWEYQHNLAMQQQAQEFQANMSNTAHQRELQDLKAAGINPILTVNGGNGASTPSGTGGSGGDSDLANAFATYQNAETNKFNANTERKRLQMDNINNKANMMLNAVNTAFSGLEKLNNAKLLNAQTMLADSTQNQMASQTRLNNSLALINEIDSIVHKETVPARIKEQLYKTEGIAADNLMKNQTTANLEAELDKIKSEIEYYKKKNALFGTLKSYSYSGGNSIKVPLFGGSVNHAYSESLFD